MYNEFFFINDFNQSHSNRYRAQSMGQGPYVYYEKLADKLSLRFNNSLSSSSTEDEKLLTFELEIDYV